MLKKLIILAILLLVSKPSSAQVDTAWVRRYKGLGNGNADARAIAVDGSGNIYVTGYSMGSGTGNDYTTIKYDPAGNQLWVQRYNGPGNGTDSAKAIAVDGSGNVYVTGVSDSNGSVFPQDYATIKYDPAGNQLWVRRYNDSANSSDFAKAIAVDGSGNVYVTGYSMGSRTSYDYATIKYDPAGNQVWVRRYNGPANYTDYASAIAVDGSGNVYVTGRSYGSGTYWDYATIKYDPAGNQLWVQRYNGPGNYYDEAWAIAVDGYGNVYVTGESGGSGTGSDYATIKYDPAGNQLWVQRYGAFANGVDIAYAIAVDGSGNVFVTGESGTSYPVIDYATIKYYPNGDTAWVRRYNGPGGIHEDVARAIAVDRSGNSYVTGYSVGTTYDYATVKYDSTGNELWVQRYDGPGNSLAIDYARAIAVDGSGNVYVTGASMGNNSSFADYATIKYVQQSCHPFVHLEPVLPEAQDTSLIMQGGSLYRYYRITDTTTNHSPVSNVYIFTKIGHSYVTDSLGILRLPVYTEEMGWTTPGNYFWNYFDHAEMCGLPATLDQVPTFNVKVLPRTFNKEWDLLAKVTTEGGVGIGAGVGPLGIRAARVSVSGSAGIGGSIAAEKSTTNPDFLTYSRRIETSFGAGLSVGRIPALSFANIRPGAGTNAEIQAQGHQTFSFNNPYADSVQMAAQATLFIQNGSIVAPGVFGPIVGPILTGLTNFVLDNSGYSQYIEKSQDELGASLGVEGTIEAGCKTQLFNSSVNKYISVELPHAQASASLTSSIASYLHSSYGDNHPDVDRALSLTETAQFEMSLIKARIGQGVGEPVTWLDQLLPYPNYDWGGEITYQMKFDHQWNPRNGSISIMQDDRGLNSDPEMTHNFESVEFDFDQNIAQSFVNTSLNFGKLVLQSQNPLAVGSGEISNDFADAISSLVKLVDSLQTTQVSYTRSRTESNVFDFGFSLPLDLGLGPQLSFDFGGGLTYTNSRSFDLEKGIIKGRDQHNYPLEEYQDDHYVQDNQTTLNNIVHTVLPAAFRVARSAIANLLTQFKKIIDNAHDTIVQTGQDIANGGAQLVINAQTYANGFTGQITSFLSGFKSPWANGQYLHYKSRAKVLSQDTLVVVTAIGKAYDVKILDLSGIPLDTFVYSVSLKVLVTDSEIVAAGFSPASRPNLKIYHWTSSLSKSVQLPSSISGDSVIAWVNSPGQYFAGLYGTPPDVTPPSIDSIYPGKGSMIFNRYPSFRVVISDTGSVSSGINPNVGYFNIDGDTVTAGFDMYSVFKGNMYFVPKDTMTLGNHYYIVKFIDMAGNATVSDTIRFSVLDYLRGDANSDRKLTVADAVYLVNYLFKGGPSPIPLAAGDANCDGKVTVADVVYLVNYLFKGGPKPPC